MGLFQGGLKDDEDENYKSMGSMLFGPKMGTWSVHSDKDKRWNKSGRCPGLVCMGGPQEMQDWIDECRKKYGDPPDDCTREFWKD